MPAPLQTLLEYLRDLGERHQDIRTSVVALPDQFSAPDAADYPLLLVEPDPFIEQLNEGADTYTVALQFRTRDARTDDAAKPELVAQAKQLADEYGQQLQCDLRSMPTIGLSQRLPTYTVFYNTLDEGMSSGVRLEIGFVVAKAINRDTNSSKFDPLP